MSQVKLLLLILAALAAAGALFAESPLDPAPTNVSFPGPGGATLKAYMATPKGGGIFPGVLMIHEWWGLNQDIKKLADALSAKGYVVLAVDAFRGKVAATPEEAGVLVRGTPGEQIRGDLDAALRYLRTRADVNPNSIGTWGFCFGGTQAMHLGTRTPELSAVVIFYGSGPIAKATDLGKMKDAGPVLGVYGEKDANIPVEQVKAFDQALGERGVKRTITLYPDVGHAFVKSDTFNQGGAAQKAWEQAIDFLDTNLKSTTTYYGGSMY